MSKCVVKAELVKRLESFHNGTENGLRVVEWRRRGRTVATRPSETVHCEDDTDSDDEIQDEDNEYKKMKKHELRQECLKRNFPASGTVKLLIARLRENDDIASKVDTNNPEKICEVVKKILPNSTSLQDLNSFVRIVSNIFVTCVKMLMRS